ncbi:efflux transporter periplasmic adaptor subunit [Thioalkalivibrio denitrificans]|uniref:Efflux transporter periplasmic adaptor subunit n=1 Tax=Thioalkalivibrio denitrificans TaxID=108003 RepID=A0A1V3NRG6_9GAMM|nr:efflux RND transporter periplasmic adaptor subunit [Thioalkalivibrio denitrificans]OOG27715.1 efflux transporter periplasmic adaptor subunit [Thioalkalivibrio denitrificans]
MNRLLLPLIVIALAGAGLWLWLSPGDDPAVSPANSPGAAVRGSTRAVAVTVAEVQTRDIREATRFTGSLTAASRVEITPRVSGRLDRIYVDIGDTVRRGDRLASLDTELFEQELQQARAELAVARASLSEAQASLEAARRALTRTRELREQRVASQSELDAAQTEVQAQEARVELARSQIDQREAAVRGAQIRLSYTELFAVWHGEDSERLVAERFADEGAILQANMPVLALVEPNPLRAVVFVTERDYARLRPGQEVVLTTEAYPGETFAGIVSRLAPEFRETSRQARVEINVPNPDLRLRPGMFVEASIRVRHIENATIVPVDALVERGGAPGVFRIMDDDEGPRVRFVPVGTGVRDGNWVEIRSPELDGRVVTLGQHLLSDGSPVQLVDPEQVDTVGAR